MTVRLLVPAVGKQANALYTSTFLAERALIDAGQADNNLDASFDYPAYLANRLVAPPVVAGPSLALSTSSVSAGATGNVAQLTSSLTGNVTYSKASGAASVTVSSVGVVALSSALAGGASATFIGRAQNDTGDAIERSLTITAQAVTPTPTPTPTPTLPNAASVNGFGSSSIVGTGATTTEARFLNKVATALNATTIRNNGIGGTVVQASNGSAGTPLVNNGRGRFVSNVLGANLSDLTIQMWPNDLRYTGNPTDFNVAGYIRDMREILNGMITGGIAPTGILLCSPTWYDTSHYAIGGTGFTGSTDAVNLTYRQATLDLAKEYATYYADIYTAIRDNGGLSLFVSGDVHWTDAGHQVAATAALAATIVNTAAKITTLTGTSTIPGQLDISGSAVAGAASYEVQIDVGAGYAYAGASATPTTLAASFTGLTQGSGYKFRARAVFGDGTKSAWKFGAGPVSIASASAGPFFNDTFTDTDDVNLANHAANTGQGWALGFGSTATTDAKIAAGRVYNTGTTGTYRVQMTAPTADYYVEAVYDFVATAASENVGFCGRMQADANSFYWARYSSTGWSLFKTVAGTATQLGATTADSFASGSKTARLTMQGSAISLSVNGSTLVSVTDTSVTGAGAPGTRPFGQTATTGHQITQITAMAL